MVALFVDVDGAEHKADPAWRAAESSKIAAALAALPGGFCYQTRGGYRIAWRLASPVTIASADDAARWRIFYWRTLLALSRRFGLEGDPACADWTRLYRLPHATRDEGGKPEDLPTEGDPELRQPLALDIEAADLAADLTEARRLEAAHPAEKDERGKTRVAAPWSAAVKALALEAGEREPEGGASLPLEDARPVDGPAEPSPRTTKARPSSEASSNQRPRITREDRERLWADRALGRMAGDLAATTRGGRNNAARDAALVLGHYAPHLLDPSDIERALLAACGRNGLVRDDGRDTPLTTIRSAISDGMSEPKRPPVSEDRAPRERRQTTHTEGAPMPTEHDQADEEHSPPPQLDPWRYHPSDIGNGERFAAHHGKNLRHCPKWGKWLVWDGRRWAEDERNDVRRRAKITALSIYQEGRSLRGGDEREQARRKTLAAWAARSEGRDRCEAMIAMAQSEPGIPVVPSELDRDPWLLNVKNGTIDLRTGKLRPHRREDLITKLAPVVYNPTAEAPHFHVFLSSITAGDQELQGFLQRFFGYALTGETTEHVLVMAYGTGSNGKSTLLKAFLELLGDYAYQAPADLIMAKKGETHPTDQTGLFGRRLAVCMETPEGRSIDEARMKALTGGDLITARRMREDFWTFTPTHKLILATNHKPVIRTTDHGTWRRQKLVPFTVQIPSDKQDKGLPEKLNTEAPGLLRWAVEGCLAWQRQGLGEPDVVKVATAGWREESDPLAAFLAAECELGEGFKVPVTDLFAAYERFATSNDDDAMSKQAFGRRLTERGMVSYRTKTARMWGGLRLRERVTMTIGDGYFRHEQLKRVSPSGEPGNNRHLSSSVTQEPAENTTSPSPSPPAPESESPPLAPPRVLGELAPGEARVCLSPGVRAALEKRRQAAQSASPTPPPASVQRTTPANDPTPVPANLAAGWEPLK